MSFINSYQFFSFNLGAIYLFFWLIAVARTSNTTLNRNDACLISKFKVKVFSFSLLCIMLAVGLIWMAFIMLKYIPSVPTMVRDFIMNGCWILSNPFSVSFEIIVWFLFFLSLRRYITLIDLQELNYPCDLGTYSIWSWYDTFYVFLDLVC